MAQNYASGAGYNAGGGNTFGATAFKPETPVTENAPNSASGYGEHYGLPSQDYNAPQQGYAGFNQQQYGQQQGYDPRQSAYSQGYQPTQYSDARPPSSQLSPSTITSALPAGAGYASSNVGSDGSEQRTYPNEKATLVTWQEEQTAAVGGAAGGSGVQQQQQQHLGEELPTHDLLRILNQRVAGGAEPQGDMPPSYR
jgi:hypothetical protein